MSGRIRALFALSLRVAAGGLFLLTLLVPDPARRLAAQTIRGTLVEEGSGRPIEGALVILLNEDGVDVSASLTDEAGAYIVRVPQSGRYTLKTERIGYETYTSHPITLSTGQVVERRLAMPVRPIELAALSVSTERRCETRAAEGARTARIWEEARKALRATALTQEQGAFRFTTRLHTSTLASGNLAVMSEQAEILTGVGTRPFQALSVEELAASGYVRQAAADTTEYFAPDADVLLSDAFQDDHCFRAVEGSGPTAGLVGLAFEPLLRDSRTDVGGVLWLDRSNAHLQFVEYRYENLPSPVHSAAIGGRLSFRRLPNGAWIVERWYIRMPLVESVEVMDRSGPPVPGNAPRKRREFRLRAIREQGGEVLIVADPAGRILVGDRPAMAGRGGVEGTVMDSTTGQPLAGATVSLVGTNLRTSSDTAGRYSMTDLPVGDFFVTFSHERATSLRLQAVLQPVQIRSAEVATVHLAVPPESVLLERLCPDNGGEGTAVLGTVTDAGSGGPVAGASVRVSNHIVAVLGAPEHAVDLAPWGIAGIDEPESLTVFETTSDENGQYLFCGLPPGMRVYAVAIGERSVGTVVAPAAASVPGNREPGAPVRGDESDIQYFTIPRGLYVARFRVGAESETMVGP